MGLNHCLDYLVKEHEELLKVAAKIESLLESASKNDFAEHVKAFAELASPESWSTATQETGWSNRGISKISRERILLESTRITAKSSTLLPVFEKS